MGLPLGAMTIGAASPKTCRIPLLPPQQGLGACSTAHPQNSHTRGPLQCSLLLSPLDLTLEDTALGVTLAQTSPAAAPHHLAPPKCHLPPPRSDEGTGQQVLWEGMGLGTRVLTP